MPRSAGPPNRLIRLALAAAVFASGCAGLPRIDPSGRRIFIWPDQQPAAAVAPPGGLPAAANLDAPPVYAGQAVNPIPPVTPPTVGSVAGAPTFVQPSPQTTTAAKPADETLSITPERLLAPIGSEVVLKAGVCNRDGYLRTNRRIEWMLGQEGAGQFVRVGEQGEMDIFRLPWQRPDKHDNAYAVGYTAPFDVCLRRGTPDTSDDVQVERGEAWITVTSASEGVSYITATAPETTNWDARRATATVYWVDAQWRFPGPQSLQPGQTGTLTTVVTRQSDGAPVEGWLVRFEVAAGGSAELGYGGGQSASVKTDASGRASVQVAPTDDQPGTAQVRIAVARPAQSAPMPSPELVVGSGDAIVSWSPTAVAVPTPTPPSVGGAPTEPPPAPFEPPPTEPVDPIGPPPQRGVGPQIDLTVERDSTGPIRPNDPVPLLVTLYNSGDEPATGISLEIDFDRGLFDRRDTLGEYRIRNDNVGDLLPNESVAVEVKLEAAAPGEQCLRVTARAGGGIDAFEQLCVQVDPPPPAAEPRLRIETDPDALKEVGQTLSFLATVYNDGDAPAENVRIEILNGPELAYENASEGAGLEALEKGVAWNGERIEAGGRLDLEVQYRCLTATPEAIFTVYALLNNQVVAEKSDASEIIRAAAAPPPAGPPAALQGVLNSRANPAQVGRSSTLDVVVTNTTDQPIQNVQFRVLFPEQIEPQLTLAASPLAFRRNELALEFNQLDVLGAGESYRVTIPYTPRAQGLVRIDLEMRAGATGAVSRAETTMSIRAR